MSSTYLTTGNPVPMPAMSCPIICTQCDHAGADVGMTGCGCYFHSRCLALPPDQQTLKICPNCNAPVRGLRLVPMSFSEVDAARRNSLRNADSKRKSKSKGESSVVDLDSKDCRTGRWTQEETAYVDEIITMFELGKLPLSNGIKLNDFLSGILQCKQSRLTKKMKNAKLSTRSFQRTTGYLDVSAKRFSDLENAFYASIVNETTRAEVRFHMQKEWRELFSNLCATIGQSLDAEEWLSSVEELERRVSLAKDAARHKRRKLMMRYAMTQDGANPDKNSFMDFRNSNNLGNSHIVHGTSTSGFDSGNQLSSGFGLSGNDDIFNLSVEKSLFGDQNDPSSSGAHMMTLQNDDGLTQARKMQQPRGQFVEKVISYIQRRNRNGMNIIQFEYVDLWVPSFVTPSNEGQQNYGDNEAEEQKCRLCFAGCGVVDPALFGKDRLGEYYNLISFGEYSQRFSFTVGNGLPGRVYQSGIPTWEQSVHNAPVHHFERCGGALQYGVKTVVGLPIPSPNVGCIVVVLYSCHDRPKDQSVVGQLSEEFTNYLPNPKWKLVVDVETKDTSNERNSSSSAANNNQQESNDQQVKKINEIVQILGEHMPSDPSSPLAAYSSGYMSLRLMLLRSIRSDQENDWTRILLGSYASYTNAGRSSHDIAALLSRDFMFLQQQVQQGNAQQQQQQQSQQQISQQNAVQEIQQLSMQYAPPIQQNVASYFAVPPQQQNLQQQFLPISCPKQPQQQVDTLSSRAFEAPRTLITE